MNIFKFLSFIAFMIGMIAFMMLFGYKLDNAVVPMACQVCVVGGCCLSSILYFLGDK